MTQAGQLNRFEERSLVGRLWVGLHILEEARQCLAGDLSSNSC